MKFSKFNIFINMEEKKPGMSLLVNTLTGAMFLLDGSSKSKIVKGDVLKLTEEEQKEYKNKGITVEDEVDEYKYWRCISEKSKYTSKVLSLTLLLTLDCNFRCVYCFEGLEKDEAGYLDDDIRNRIFKFITNKMDADKNIEILSIVLFGGEPLLGFDKNIHWLDDIKKYCEDNGKRFVTSIVTNGSLISNEILEKLLEYNCGLIQVTVDGIKELHDTRRVYSDGKGTYDDILKGIKTILDFKLLNPPVIRINLDKSNIRYIDLLLKELSDKDFNKCTIDFGIVRAGVESMTSYNANCFEDCELGDVLEPLWNKLKKLNFNFNMYPYRKELFCGLMKENAYTITPYGDVYKCWELLEDKYKIGSINKGGYLENIPHSYLDWMSRSFIDNEHCGHCPYLPVCGGGCASVSKEKNGTIHSEGCFKTKSIFNRQVKFNYINTIL